MPLPPQEIKAELVRRGITITKIAKSLGVTPGHVSNVIKGRRSGNVERAIAQAIGKPVGRVFEPSPTPSKVA